MSTAYDGWATYQARVEACSSLFGKPRWRCVIDRTFVSTDFGWKHGRKRRTREEAERDGIRMLDKIDLTYPTEPHLKRREGTP